MTAKELDKLFESGEKLTEVFSIRKVFYDIGCIRITERQAYALKSRYKDRMEHSTTMNGYTRHYYEFKKIWK